MVPLWPLVLWTTIYNAKLLATIANNSIEKGNDFQSLLKNNNIIYLMQLLACANNDNNEDDEDVSERNLKLVIKIEEI